MTKVVMLLMEEILQHPREPHTLTNNRCKISSINSVCGGVEDDIEHLSEASARYVCTRLVKFATA